MSVSGDVFVRDKVIMFSSLLCFIVMRKAMQRMRD